jgi:hypothetical protein
VKAAPERLANWSAKTFAERGAGHRGRVRMRERHWWIVCAGALVATLPSVDAQAPAAGPTPDAWYMKADPRKLKIIPYTDPAGRFSIEVPKDWVARAPGLSTLAIFEQRRGEASVTVERVFLARSPGAIDDTLVGIEIENIHAVDPKAGKAEWRIIEQDGRKVPVMQYTTPGLRGPEQVRVYVVLVGRTLDRIICRAPQANFSKYEPVFAHLVATMTPTASAS